MPIKNQVLIVRFFYRKTRKNTLDNQKNNLKYFLKDKILIESFNKNYLKYILIVVNITRA